MIRFFCAMALLVGAACAAPEARGNVELDVRIRLGVDEPVSGPVEVTVDVRDMAWRPVNGALVVLSGHLEGVDGPSAVDTLSGLGAGKYSLPERTYTPAGRWTLTARVELPGQRWVEVDRVVEVAGSGSRP